MQTIIVQSRVKPTLKNDAETIFEGMGINMADAIRMFLQQTVNVGGLPFTPGLRPPAPPETLEAIAEYRSGVRHPFTNMRDLLAEDDE